MAADPNDPLLAFLLGRGMAEQLGLTGSQASQWGAVQTAFGLSVPGLLLVRALAERDAAADASAADAQRRQIAELQASVDRLAEAARRTERATLDTVAAVDRATEEARRAADNAAAAAAAVQREAAPVAGPAREPPATALRKAPGPPEGGGPAGGG